jgi:predicted MFS family arabinose efflux permease
VLFPILGIAVGAMELVTVIYVASHSSRSSTGIFLALTGLGSCLSGLYFGTLRLTSDMRRRTLTVSAVLCACLMPVPLLLDGNLLLFGAWIFVVGAAFAPFLITALGLLQQLTPEERMNEGMSLVDAGLIGGQAIGLSASGAIAAVHGASFGFLTVSVAGLLTLLVAAGGARWMGR